MPSFPGPSRKPGTKRVLSHSATLLARPLGFALCVSSRACSLAGPVERAPRTCSTPYFALRRLRVILGSEAPGCAIVRGAGRSMMGPTCSCRKSGAGLPAADQVGGSPASHHALALSPPPALRVILMSPLPSEYPGRLTAAVAVSRTPQFCRSHWLAGSFAHCHWTCVLLIR